MVRVVKKDHTKEPFNIQKVVIAVNKSANRVLYNFTEDELKSICNHVEGYIRDHHMTEIQKLDLLLKRAKVPHTYGRRWPEMDRPDNQEFLPGGRHDGGEQIIAYDAAGNRIWDGVWGWGSYGFGQGLIEAMADIP